MELSEGADEAPRGGSPMWRLFSAPRGCFDPIPPALRLPGHKGFPDRLKADNEPQTGPGAGRAECRRRPSQNESENSPCRGPPALPVKLPVDTDPFAKSGETECRRGFGGGDRILGSLATAEHSTFSQAWEKVVAERPDEG